MGLKIDISNQYLTLGVFIKTKIGGFIQILEELQGPNT